MPRTRTNACPGPANVYGNWVVEMTENLNPYADHAYSILVRIVCCPARQTVAV